MANEKCPKCGPHHGKEALDRAAPPSTLGSVPPPKRGGFSGGEAQGSLVFNPDSDKDCLIKSLERQLEEAKEELEAVDENYRLLASEMVYHGNSVQHWYDKATAYKRVVGQMCDIVAAHGYSFDGHTSVLTIMDKALSGLKSDLDAALAIQAQRAALYGGK